MSDECIISCGVCGGHVAFPIADMGRAVACPHCTSQIILSTNANRAERWTYFVGKKSFGPCSTEQITKLLISKAISPSTIVIREGGEDRRPMSKLPEFFEISAKLKAAKPDYRKLSEAAVYKALSFVRLHKRISLGACIAILIIGVARWGWGVRVAAIKKADQDRLAAIAQQQAERTEADRITVQKNESERQADVQRRIQAEQEKRAVNAAADQSAEKTRVEQEKHRRINDARLAEKSAINSLLNNFKSGYNIYIQGRAADIEQTRQWAFRTYLFGQKAALTTIDLPTPYTDPATGLSDPNNNSSSADLLSINKKLNALTQPAASQSFGYDPGKHIWVYRYNGSIAPFTGYMFSLSDLDASTGQRYRQNNCWYIEFTVKGQEDKVISYTYHAGIPNITPTIIIGNKVVFICSFSGNGAVTSDVDVIMERIGELIRGYDGKPDEL